MSGTSLDGLDLACCTFSLGDKWNFRIDHAVTYDYPLHWSGKLKQAHLLSGEMLGKLDCDLGNYYGQLIRDFLAEVGFVPDFIASHGHTVFHQPEQGFTLQIGNGHVIAEVTGLPVIFDFRSLDVARGGQGAPLVPVGDRLLFDDFDYCLNIGGIANISFEQQGRRVAFDVCVANMLLNELSSRKGLAFDKDGELAAEGSVNDDLLSKMNNLAYYRQTGSKTLGREWFESHLLPLVNSDPIPTEDLLRTAVEHIAIQIGRVFDRGLPGGRLLMTGGGALNGFLVSRIRARSKVEVVVPEERLVHFKEALIFAFLGVLRARGEINCLASVTGASRDSCAGLMTA